MNWEKAKSLIGILVIFALFALFSYLAKANSDFLNSLVGNNFEGALIYILITIIAIVIAPISTVPLIPLASNAFGWVPAGIFSIVGWFIGSLIVFLICRTYLVRLVKKFIPLKDINRLESKIPKENMFWDLVLLRMIIPVDVLSYALGIFSKVDIRTYAITTVIGITPFAFIFSYLGTISFYQQVAGFAAVIILLLLVNLIRRKRHS